MKRVFALLLPVLILLTFALLRRQEQETHEGDALVYLLAEEGSAGSDAIAGFYVDLGLAEDAAPREQAEAIVEALISGVPGGESPLPGGVHLRDISIQGSRAYVDFSSGYGALTGIELSLEAGAADAVDAAYVCHAHLLNNCSRAHCKVVDEAEDQPVLVLSVSGKNRCCSVDCTLHCKAVCGEVNLVVLGFRYAFNFQECPLSTYTSLMKRR